MMLLNAAAVQSNKMQCNKPGSASQPASQPRRLKDDRKPAKQTNSKRD